MNLNKECKGHWVNSERGAMAGRPQTQLSRRQSTREQPSTCCQCPTSPSYTEQTAITSEGQSSRYKNSSWETKINSVSTAVLQKWAAARGMWLGNGSRGVPQPDLVASAAT